MVTIDPARRLASALGLDELSGEPRRIDPSLLAAQGVKAPGELWAMALDVKRTFDEIVTRLSPDARSRDEILENPVYRELSSAISGVQELGAVTKLYELYSEYDFDVIVLDTPPSRNALDFLVAPENLLNFLEGRALKVFLAPGGLAARFLGRGTGLVFGIFARVTGVDMLGELSTFFRSLSGHPRRLRRAPARRRRAAARTGHELPDRHLPGARARPRGDLPGGQARRGGDDP